MALATLESEGVDGGDLLLRIDTGTNDYYQLKIGRRVRRRHGIDWIDDVYLTTPVRRNPAAGELLNSSSTITVPRQQVELGRAYGQLFSFKDTGGRSPAYSDVVPLPLGGGDLREVGLGMSVMSTAAAMTPLALSFQPPRQVPCRTCRQELAQPASVGDLLGQIARIAGPVVVDLLRSGAGTTAPSGSSGGGPAPAPLLAALLETLLRGLSGPPTQLPSQQQSLADDGNRFAMPFVWGALIGQIAGSLVQVLPQLANAANQKRLGLRQADNRLIADILSDVNRRMLLQQILDAQRQTATAQPAADLAALAQLLQQVTAAPPGDAGSAASEAPQGPPVPSPAAAPAPAAAPVPAAPAGGSGGLSLATSRNGHGRTEVLSSRAVVSFVHGPPTAWHGSEIALFSRRGALKHRIRLDVGEPVPKRPLPKAIVTLTYKDPSNEAVLHQATFKLKDVAPNANLTLDLGPGDVAHLPIGQRLVALAEMRWQGSKPGAVHKALGSTEVAFVDKYFVKGRGTAVSEERELFDMNQYRAFWNKIWESPVLDRASSGNRKLLWELNVTARYSVLLTPGHDANGLMEKKILRAPDDVDSVSDRTHGRLKGGIELSISELNKLSVLWPDQAVLEREKLEALLNPSFAREYAGEVIRSLKFKGKAAERGIVWIGPVFKLFELTLASVRATDESGQVTDVDEERVRFPLPVSVRIIGLKSD